MTVEIIRSKLGATLAAGETGRIIEPCDSPNGVNLKPERCKYRGVDGQGLCSHPEGLIPGNNKVYCPLQRGHLRISLS